MVRLLVLLGALQIPVDLVFDHSVQVDYAGVNNALTLNMEREFKAERFALLKWGATAFSNMVVVPSGTGIVHQVKTGAPFLSFLLAMLHQYNGHSMGHLRISYPLFLGSELPDRRTWST